jgi:5-oxoprolinase (ATP-hydrolysing) subunit A
MAAEDAAYAMAIGRAIQAVDRNIIYVALSGTEMQKAAEKLGLPMALEGFPDRRYADDGNLASRAIPGSVLKDPKAAAEQAVRMVRDGEIVAMSGKRIKVKVHTLCVHGDEATGVAVARGIRQALEAADISVVPLTDMQL